MMKNINQNQRKKAGGCARKCMEDAVPAKSQILFAKTHPKAKIPTKDVSDAGFDIYACFDEDYMIIAPWETAMIPTGIASALHPSKYIQIEERGSTGSIGMKKSAGVIDSGYRGEWFVAITNCSRSEIIISKLERDELLTKHAKTGTVAYGYIQYLSKNNGEIEGLLRVVDEINDTKDVSDCGIIYPYSKAIAQAVVHEVPFMDVMEIDYENLKKINSNRGTGRLGSSGK